MRSAYRIVTHSRFSHTKHAKKHSDGGGKFGRSAIRLWEYRSRRSCHRERGNRSNPAWRTNGCLRGYAVRDKHSAHAKWLLVPSVSAQSLRRPTQLPATPRLPLQQHRFSCVGPFESNQLLREARCRSSVSVTVSVSDLPFCPLIFSFVTFVRRRT